MSQQFPKWKPNVATNSKFGHEEYRVRYKALRNSSSGFIKRKDVKDFLLRKHGRKCAMCGSNELLQIDHIVSVYECAMGNLPIDELNRENNLQLLCSCCNGGKAP